MYQAKDVQMGHLKSTLCSAIGSAYAMLNRVCIVFLEGLVVPFFNYIASDGSISRQRIG